MRTGGPDLFSGHLLEEINNFRRLVDEIVQKLQHPVPDLVTLTSACLFRSYPGVLVGGHHTG